jgi:hypothetical protein
MNPQALHQRVRSLLLYSTVLEQAPIATWAHLLHLIGESPQSPPPALQAQVLQTYGQWFQALAAVEQGWQDYVFEALITAVNPFTQQIQRTDWRDLPMAMRLAVQHDLQILQQMYQWDCVQIVQAVQQSVPELILISWVDRIDRAPFPHRSLLPKQQDAAVQVRSQLDQLPDWTDVIPSLVDYYRQFGTGIFAQFYGFRWEGQALVGIPQADPVRLANLVGYDWQQDALVQNTKALLSGYTALNVLLYGSRGSGKSSLIKSLINEFGDAGLRLIEVSKAQLGDLPQILEPLRSCPQKFIIFVDDLSFEEDDDAFKALKVVLEGGVTARPQNVVVYATSNRRHLIREFYGDRPRPKDADEMHQWDTVQEKLSFSDRFGLTLTFEPANQSTYLQIVHHLAQTNRLAISNEDLEFRALQWATQHNGRSGRTARQFIDYLTADLALNAAAGES